jgi:hypothetical protein
MWHPGAMEDLMSDDPCESLKSRALHLIKSAQGAWEENATALDPASGPKIYAPDDIHKMEAAIQECHRLEAERNKAMADWIDCMKKTRRLG